MANDNSKTLYSYYELGVYTMQLILQKSLKDSHNENYQNISFDDESAFFFDRVNSMMKSMHIEFILNCDNICLEVMDEISNKFSEPQKGLKYAAYYLGKDILFLQIHAVLSCHAEDVSGADNTKNEIRTCLKKLNINDSEVLDCLNFEKIGNKSLDDYENCIEQKIQYFHMLIKLYLSSIKIEHSSPEENSDIKFEYDVVLSFAGEDREYVDFIANELKAKGVRVFYDKFETVKLWGKDLYQYFAYIYKADSRYCIPFISEHYKNKVWTKHELRNAQNRALHENREYLLPIYLENVELEGLNDSIAHIKASEYTQREIVDIILKKLQ